MAGDPTNRERAASALVGVRVAITRPEAGADPFAEALERAGARVVRASLIRISPPLNDARLKSAAQALGRYDWIVFTSANAVSAFGARVDPEVAGRVRSAVVGPVTAAAASAVGFAVEAIAQSQLGSAVAAAMARAGPIAGCRVLWPRAANARRSLAESLRALGAQLDEVEVYRTEPDGVAAAKLAAAVARGEVDALTFTSPSAVRAYADAGGSAISIKAVAAIGPVTAMAAREAGLPVHVQPDEHTTDAMVEALRAFFDRQRHTDAAP